MTLQSGKSIFDSLPCNVYHEERRVWCALSQDHEGPHGWDYEAGRVAVETVGDKQAKLREGGLDHLADRLAWLVKG